MQSPPEPQFPTWKERHWFDLSCPRYRCTSRLWSAFRLGRLTRLINLGGPSFGADQALLVAGWMPSCLGGGLQAAGIRRPRGDRSAPCRPCAEAKMGVATENWSALNLDRPTLVFWEGGVGSLSAATTSVRWSEMGSQLSFSVIDGFMAAALASQRLWCF